MAKRMNMQIAAFCHFYWQETKPGVDRLYRKLLDWLFSQVLFHRIRECMWDTNLKAVTLPSAQLEMSAISDFEQQEWVRNLAQEDQSKSAKMKHINPNMSFPLQVQLKRVIPTPSPRQLLCHLYPWNKSQPNN